NEPTRAARPPSASRCVASDTGEGASEPTRERVETSPNVIDGSHVHWSASQDPRQHLLGQLGERLFLCGQIGLPRLGVPDLVPRVRPDDHAVALQARVLSQALGDRDPALLVRLLVGSAGEEDPAVIAHRLRGERRGTESLGDAPELLYREDVEAALPAFGYHQTRSDERRVGET